MINLCREIEALDLNLLCIMKFKNKIELESSGAAEDGCRSNESSDLYSLRLLLLSLGLGSLLFG